MYLEDRQIIVEVILYNTSGGGELGDGYGRLKHNGLYTGYT